MLATRATPPRQITTAKQQKHNTQKNNMKRQKKTHVEKNTSNGKTTNTQQHGQQ